MITIEVVQKGVCYTETMILKGLGILGIRYI